MTKLTHGADGARLAGELEAHLGDPHDAERPFSFARAVDADEREAFPEEPCKVLHEWGYLRHLVPESAGGKLVSFDGLLLLGRVVARRDLTVAIATGQTLLGSLGVWIQGDDDQRRRVAELVLRGGAGCLALTEEAHGSDLAAGEVSAAPGASGWTASGTKWCINNASRGEFLTMLARTAADGGIRSHSLLLVDKRCIPAGSYENIPRLRTHGIRGADISGVRFDETPLGDGALVGREGHGLDLVFKALQVSRTMCAALSLGAADTAVRLAMDFARGRVLYGRPAYAIPAVRRTLADAFADLMVVDALGAVACRALSLAPGEMSVLSSVVKLVVPTVVEGIVRDTAVILGARHYLREGPFAAFQKLLRDSAVVGLFDGSSAVNMFILGAQMPRLAEGRVAAREGDEEPLRPGGLFDVGASLAPFAWDALRATSRGRDSVTGALPALVAVAARASGASASGAALVALAKGLADELVALDAATLALAAKEGSTQDDPRTFALARRYCMIVAGTALLGTWLARSASGHPVSSGQGACAAHGLARVLEVLAPGRYTLDDAIVDASASHLEELHRGRRLFSATPVALAPPAGADRGDAAVPS